MQTFLPYEDFRKSLAVLDSRRLCKQVVEAWQILTGRVPQANHPACLMWEHCRPALARYLLYACEEYAVRYGKDHSILEKLLDMPISLGQWEFHVSPLMRLSHCVNLWRKGVSVEAMQREADRIATVVFGAPVELAAYPEGYFWPVQPKGKKASADRKRWLTFWKVRAIPGRTACA